MEIQIAVAKVAKWASRESGDTLEMIERPGGGLSLVLDDASILVVAVLPRQSKDDVRRMLVRMPL